MKRWLAAQVGRLVTAGTGVVVILDPDGALTDADVADLAGTIEVIRVTNWIDLRRVWDLDIRRRENYQGVALLVVSGDIESTNDLPWDVEHEATAVVRVRWPVPAEIRPLFRAARDHADVLAEAAQSHASTGDILAAAFGIHYGASADELDTVARLRLDPSTPPELWDVLSQVLVTPLARQIAVERGHLDALQAAWDDWLRVGDASPAATVLQAAPGAVLALLGSGLLAPAPVAATDLPKWVSIGAADPDPDSWSRSFSPPGRPNQPTCTTGSRPRHGGGKFGLYRHAAGPTSVCRDRLGNLATDRYRVRSLAPPLVRHESAVCRRNACVLSTSCPVPGPARRGWCARAPGRGRRSRVRAVAPDAHSHGAEGHPSHRLSATIRHAHRRLAPSDLRGRGAERVCRHDSPPPALSHGAGQSFWAGRGLAAREVTYSKTLGSDPGDVPKLAGRVAAVVVYAVDEMLHGAEVLGDRQVAAGVDSWVRAGFPQALVEAGIQGGFEVWITSDHGNLPTVAGPVPSEGQTVESAGNRVRMYPNDTLRDAAIDYGDIWNPPGYPDGQLRPLFAPGRRGYHPSGVKVSHGGLSLDEVIVPFVQVTT